MAVIDVGKFGPVYFDGRRIDLPADSSLGIENVRLGGERLEAVAAPAIVSTWPDPELAPTIARRPYIYRTGSHSNQDARAWAFDSTADIARTPIQGDDEDRICITGWFRTDVDPLAPATGAPKTISKTIAAATPFGDPEPNDWNYLGVPAPTLPPVLTGVTPSTAIVITQLDVGNLLLYRTYADIPNWTTSGAPGDGDSDLQLGAGVAGEHIFGGFIPGQRMVVTEVVDEDTVRIAAPNADRAIGDLNTTYAWRFTSDVATQVIATWRLPKIGTATIDGHKLQVNDVLRVTQVTVNPAWYSTDAMNLAPSSGLERIAVPDTGGISFVGKVSCVVEPPGLPVVYDNDGALILTAAPSPLAWNVTSDVGAVTARSCSAIPYGGTGPFTYLWTWQSGGTGLTLAGTTTSTVTVSRTYTAAENASYGGTLRCTVTDSFATVASVDVAVSAVVTAPGASGGGGSLAVTLAPSPASATVDSAPSAGTLNRDIVASISGGTAPFTYAWAFTSGGDGLSLINPTIATVTVRRTYTINESFTGTGTVRCTVTDANGASGFAETTATLTIGGTFSVVPINSFASKWKANYFTGTWDNITINKTFGTIVTGGASPYTYLWTWIGSPSSSAWLSQELTATARLYLSLGEDTVGYKLGTLRCVVTDDNGATTTLDIPIDVTWDGVRD